MSKAAVPRWARALLALDRALDAAHRARVALRDEALLSWLDDRERSALTEAIYASRGTYSPGSSTWAQGLFAWEEEALAQMDLRPGSRVLVGGAGGGRELIALTSRGCAVTGFDPVEAMVRAGRDALPAGATLLRGSYADLVRAGDGEGPLREISDGPPFDAAVLGWASLSHVERRDDRRAVFSAMARLVPSGAMLVSAMQAPPLVGRSEAMQRALRRGFAALGAPGRPEPEAVFSPSSGFAARVTLDELDAHAEATGWTRRWASREAAVRAVYVRAG